jgi:hypothetical protein
MSFALTKNQVSFRGKVLIRNLRETYWEVAGWSDAEVLGAYNMWFGLNESDHEPDFIFFVGQAAA